MEILDAAIAFKNVRVAGDCTGLQKLRDVGSQSLVRSTECPGLPAQSRGRQL